MDAAKAMREMQLADQEVELAKEQEIHIKQTSNHRRQERLKEVIEPGKNPALQNARIVNVYAITDQEIQESAFNTSMRIEQLHESEQRLKLEQSRLARFLQIEERTRKLCDRLVEMKKVETIREG